MTCKDCIHYNVCESRICYNENFGSSDEIANIEDRCKEFIPVHEHGKWEKHAMDVAEHPLHCSVCGWSNYHIQQRYILDFDYCPHCGAKIDE